MAEYQDLQILGSIPAGEQHQQLDGAAQGQVGEVRQQAADLRGGQRRRHSTASHGANCQLTGPNRVCAPYRLLADAQTKSDAVGRVDWDVVADATVVRVHQHAAGARTP
jgi:hypothetical protein